MVIGQNDFFFDVSAGRRLTKGKLVSVIINVLLDGARGFFGLCVNWHPVPWGALRYRGNDLPHHLADDMEYSKSLYRGYGYGVWEISFLSGGDGHGAHGMA